MIAFSCTRPNPQELIMRRHYPFDHPYAVANQLDPSLDSQSQQFNRKRQRRQAAAVVVESLFNNGATSSNNGGASNKTGNTSMRKSTAQPRPVHKIPPRGIGPISDPNENDVLCGRGGRINSHAGNVQFRDIIHSKKKDYLAPTTKKLEKAHIAAGIVNDIRSMDPPGRFLKEEGGTGMWYDIGDAKAIKKTGQALREDAPDIRPVIDVDGGSSGDENKVSGNKNEHSNLSNRQGHLPMDSRIPSSISPRGHSRRGNTVQRPQQNIQPTWPQQQQQQQQQQMNDNNVPGFGMSSQYPSNTNSNFYSSQMQMPLMQEHEELRYDQQGLQTRNIRLQSFPNQSYPQDQSANHRIGHLQDPAFDNMLFHDPNAPRMLSDDQTFSTISGLSDPVSSLGGSNLMTMSLKSNFSLNNSAHNSLRTGRTGGSLRTFDSMATSGFGLSGSIKSGFAGSLGRSNSFSDLDSIARGADSWKYEGQISEGQINDLDQIMERPRTSGRFTASGMSIGSLMDMQSIASSTQWAQEVLRADDKSFVSAAMMSVTSETLDALDLAI